MVAKFQTKWCGTSHPPHPSGAPTSKKICLLSIIISTMSIPQARFFFIKEIYASHCSRNPTQSAKKACCWHCRRRYRYVTQVPNPAIAMGFLLLAVVWESNCVGVCAWEVRVWVGVRGGMGGWVGLALCTSLAARSTLPESPPPNGEERRQSVSTISGVLIIPDLTIFFMILI